MPFGAEGREDGVALALSGGGYRAVLFHCGALIRLNELGALHTLKRVSSVSGGSITAGMLALKWDRLKANPSGAITNLDEQVLTPLRDFCSKTLDVGAVLWGAINPFKTAGDELIDAYRDRLGFYVGLKSLGATGPRFVFNATNYATGVSFRFSPPYCGDYRIGLIRDHSFDLATAVACSSAFPPVFAPVTLDVDPDKFEHTLGADLWDRKEFRTRLLLADGGVYDNMGLETVWGRYSTVLVSDGGKPFELQDSPSESIKQLARVADIGLNQALALRKRVLIDCFQHQQAKGTYWGIGTLLADYGLGADTLPVSSAKASGLASMRTRLNRFSAEEQEELINWGYAVCDAAMRAHVPVLYAAASTPAGFPYPSRGMT